MATSVGERAKQDAIAYSSRWISRDLKILVLGAAEHRSVHSGKTLMMAPHKQRIRIDVFANKHDDEPDRFDEVDDIALVGLLHERAHYDEILAWLDGLEMHIPLYQDIHEENLFDKLNARDIPVSSLGRMGSPLKDLALGGWKKDFYDA